MLFEPRPLPLSPASLGQVRDLKETNPFSPPELVLESSCHKRGLDGIPADRRHLGGEFTASAEKSHHPPIDYWSAVAHRSFIVKEDPVMSDRWLRVLPQHQYPPPFRQLIIFHRQDSSG